METNNTNNVEENVTANAGTEDNGLILTDEQLRDDIRVQKMIQSAEDRVRTKYSNDIKNIKASHATELEALKEELATLKPVEKSEKELSLEAKEKELAEKERVLRFKEFGIDDSITPYLTSDCDVESFSNTLKEYIETQVNNRVSTNSFVPTGSASGNTGTLTKADYHNLSYGEREKLYAESPELVELLR